jgi:hypothetical protein
MSSSLMSSAASTRRYITSELRELEMKLVNNNILDSHVMSDIIQKIKNSVYHHVRSSYIYIIDILNMTIIIDSYYNLLLLLYYIVCFVFYLDF